MSDLPAAVDREIAALETRMRDDRDGYFRDDGAQGRYRQLIEAKEGGGPVPAPDERAREITAIERTIQTDRNAYFRDSEMQARYTFLLAQRDGAAPTGKASALRDDGARGIVAAPSPEDMGAARAFFASARGQEIIADWQRNGGVESNARASDAMAMEFSRTLPEETRADFDFEFRSLPVPVQFIMRCELANPYVKLRATASRAQMEKFGGTSEGAELIAEWGDGARRKVAVANARAERVFSKLSENEKRALDDFLNAIDGRAWKAILAHLARAA